MSIGATAPSGLAQEPRRGGMLVYAVLGDPPTIDCHAASSFASMHYLSPHYSLLIRIDPNDPSKVAPDVAATWTEAPDKLSYTFRLRPGVTFHDGKPLTSADVKATFQRLRDPPAGVTSLRRSNYQRITAIETPDPATVIFRLAAASPAFLASVASPFNCLYSAERLAIDPSYPTKEVMGSGPYVFGERVAGSHWVGKRFEGYFDKPRPYLDGFRAVNVAAASLATAIQSGQVMTEFRTLAPAARDRIKAALGDGVRFHTRPYDFLITVAFNTRKAPFDDARVRRALSLAIDRWAAAEALAKVSSMAFVGGTQRPQSPWAATESELTAQPGFGRDIAAARAEAKRLLKEAGREGLTLRLVNRNIADPYTSAGVYLVDQWRQIGVTAEHVQVDVRTLTTAMQSGEFDAIIDFQGENVDDPSIALARNVSADISSYNPSGFIDRTIDDIYRGIDTEFDVARRRALVRQLEARLFTEAYQVPFLWLNRTVAMPARLQGFIMTPSHFLTQDLSGLWLAEKRLGGRSGRRGRGWPNRPTFVYGRGRGAEGTMHIEGWDIDILVQVFPGKSVCHGGLGWSTVVLLRGRGRVALVDAGTFSMRKLVIDGLARHGLKPADVTDLLLTHSHWDHSVNWPLLRHARIALGSVELAWALEQPWGETPVPELYVERLQSWPTLAQVTDGAEVLPGIRAHIAPGHTPGCLVYVLEGRERDVIFTGDAAKNRAELVSRTTDMTYDAAVSRASIDMIWRHWQRRPGSVVIPGHDLPMTQDGGETRYLGTREAAITCWYGDDMETTTYFKLTA